MQIQNNPPYFGTQQPVSKTPPKQPQFSGNASHRVEHVEEEGVRKSDSWLLKGAGLLTLVGLGSLGYRGIGVKISKGTEIASKTLEFLKNTTPPKRGLPMKILIGTHQVVTILGSYMTTGWASFFTGNLLKARFDKGEWPDF